MHRVGIAAIGGLFAVAAAQVAAPAPATALDRPAGTSAVVLELAPQDPAAMRGLSAQHRLGPSQRLRQLAAAAPSAATRTEVVRRALALGLTVNSTNDFSVMVSGPVALIGTLFGKHPAVATAGIASKSTSTSTSVPLAFDGLVTNAISSDQSRVRMHPLLSRLPRSAGPNVIGLSPGEVDGARARALYGAPASTGSYSARRLTIATIQFSGWNPADLTAFAAGQLPGLANPVASGQYVGVSATGSPTTPDNAGGDVEVALDQEALLATAPQANQRAYFVNNSSTSDFATAIDQIASDALKVSPPITALSISWGACENTNPLYGFTPSDQATLDAEFAKLTATGVTIFAAAGDAGAYDCSRANTAFAGTLAVDYPGSSTHVISVGGLATGSPTNPAAPTESAWWDGTSVGGGGGQSVYESRPAYQPGSPTIAGSGRLVPDISLTADPNQGYFQAYSSAVQIDPVTHVSTALCGWCQVGGTSLASPLAAATMTDVQIAAGAGASAQWGEIGPLLYGAANSPGAFRDIRNGTNGGFGARAGYDQASGLGAPNWSGIWWSAQLPLSTKSTRIPAYGRATNLFTHVPPAPNIPGLTGIGYRDGTGTPPVGTSGGWSTAEPTGLLGGVGPTTAWLQYKYSDNTVLTVSGPTFLDDVAPVVAMRAALAPATGSLAAISWGGTDAGSGIATFTVQVYRAGVVAPVFAQVRQPSALRSMSLPVLRGATYNVRIFAVDKSGNRSTVVRATVAVPLSSASMRYSGNWLTRATATSIANTRHDSAATAATATLTFTARTFNILATTCPACGNASVFVDGRLRAIVSTYSPSIRYNVSIYGLNFTVAGRHTIVVQVRGQRITASRGTAILLNGLLAIN